MIPRRKTRALIVRTYVLAVGFVPVASLASAVRKQRGAMNEGGRQSPGASPIAGHRRDQPPEPEGEQALMAVQP